MDCPKCVGLLEKKKIEEIEVDVCSVCEGIWFDAGELEEIIKKDSKDFDFIDVGKDIYDGKELKEADIDLNRKTGKCPRCGEQMLQSQYEHNHSVTVDMCPKGHGIWLDGGEILKLRKRGLINLRDWVGNELEFVKYAFSKKGFQGFKDRIFRKKK